MPVLADSLYLVFSPMFLLVLARDHKAHNTFIKHSYKDGDPLGPEKWESLPDATDTTNFCGLVQAPEGQNFMNPGTPLNILMNQATLPIREIDEELELDTIKPSLTFQMREGLETIHWQLGYPVDIYHGLELRGPRLGLIQVLDSYDPFLGIPVSYDFNFASVTACDFSVASKERTSHQLDGKRFPFEINMVFISQPREIGMDNNLWPKDNDTRIVMISVLGEIGDSNNPLLEPLISAAQKYKGGDFAMDDTDEDYYVNIDTPFSPTWLLPKSSQYFYYHHGTFPSPPCFPMEQVYVFKTPISISKKQLSVLTSMATEREPDKKFSCTFGLLRTQISPTEIYYNPYPHNSIGTDNRPDADETAGAPILALSSWLIMSCLSFSIFFAFVI